MPLIRIEKATIENYSPASEYGDFKNIYINLSFGNHNGWFLLVEHSTKPSRLQDIKRFGDEYNIGDSIDFSFEITSTPNRTNKLKIKSLSNHIKKT